MSTISDNKSVGDTSQRQTSDAQTMRDRWEALSQEERKTWLFGGCALACLLVTGLFELASRPAEIQEYGRVGEEFYPEFTDPTLATSLTVSVIDAEEVKPLSFSVKQAENGRWVIPSHHNYPADAADQLAETASSVIGIQRGAMVTRWASDHARYGVVNPETDSVGVDELEGIGKRLTLRGKDDAVLASYIIGKKVEGESDEYYVRHPGEDETYIAKLDISLSTKFTDWVNTDLLDIDSFDVRRVDVNDYSFDELRGTVTGKVESKLSRDSSSDDWKIEGIDEQTQEVDKDAMQDTVNELANLEIAGVRPKQPGLTADLKLDRSALKSQRDVDRLQSDLLSRGFLLQPSQSDPETLTLISREGEMSVGTEDGLFYKLHFGRVFTGSEEELEIGLSSDDEGDESTEQGDDDDSASDEASDDAEEASEDKDDSESTGGDEAEAGEEGTEDSADEDDADSNNKPGRYVFVRVDFSQSLLGDEPKPVQPEMPEELKEAEKKEAEADGGASEDADSEGDADDSKDEESVKADESDPSDGEESEEKESEEDKLQKIRDEYNDAKQKYQDDIKALEDFNEKVKEGTDKAEELNRRFAQWYYVITGDSYDKLTLSRDDLIKAKEKEEEDEDKKDEDSSEGPSIDSASLAPPANNSEEAESADAKEGSAEMKESQSEPSEAAPSESQPKEAAEDSKPDSGEEKETADSKKSDEESSDSADKDKPKPDPEPAKEDKPDSGGETPEETETPSEKEGTDSAGDSSENDE